MMDKEQDEYEEFEQQEEMYEETRPSNKRRGGKIVGLPTSASGNKLSMIVYQPSTNEDTQNIIDNIKARKPVIVNLDDLDTDVAQRVLDFLSGAIYALNGNIKKVARSIFVVAPSNVDIASNEGESDRNHDFED
ncbi:MAG: cell division protein SepF [Eubacteriales bacterium]